MTAASVGALLFDLGGVVFEIDFDRALRHWARGAGVSPESLRARFAPDAHYARYERGEIDAGAYFDSLRGSLGIEIGDEALRAGWNAIFKGEANGIAAELVRAARSLPIYAFSNTNPLHRAEWAGRFASLLAPFREIFVSFELGHRKPEPAAYREVCSRMGMACSSVLFFDDSAENVEGARVLGMRAVQVRSTADVRAALDELLASA
jgi:putative hydrolase of the HAD superfamily